MGPVAIPSQLFRCETATAQFPGLAKQIGSDATRLGEAATVAFTTGLKELRRFALARLGDRDGFDIHRLVQDVTADQLTEANRAAILTALTEWMIAFGPDQPHVPSTWAVWDDLWPHASALWMLVKDDLATEARIDLGDRLSALLFGKGRYTESLLIDETILPATEQRYGPNSGQVAHVLTGIGEARRLGGGSSEGLVAIYERALAIARMNHGPQAAAVAHALNYVGLACKHVGRLDEAEHAYREALEIYERQARPSAHRLALALDNLGNLLRTRGSVEEATTISERAVALGRNVDGKPHIYFGQLLIHYAEILMLGSRMADAERAALEAVRAAEEPYGRDHHFTLTALEVLSKVLEAQEKWHESVPHRRALAERLIRTDAGSQTAIVAMHHLALALSKSGDRDAAVSQWRDALRAKERLSGPDDRETLVLVRALAESLAATGAHDESEALRRRLVDARGDA
jgi:tetratricopeptide (TPR) repeat protein